GAHGQQNDAAYLQCEHAPGKVLWLLLVLTQQGDDLQAQGTGKQIGEESEQVQQQVCNKSAQATNGVIDVAAARGEETRVVRRIAHQGNQDEQTAEKAENQGPFPHDAL